MRTIINAKGLAIAPVAITPDDTAANLNDYDLLWIGGAGNIVITPWPEDPEATVPTKLTIAVPAGAFPTPVTKVWATNTTATGIYGCLQG